jgi:hypothetical protein
MRKRALLQGRTCFLPLLSRRTVSDGSVESERRDATLNGKKNQDKVTTITNKCSNFVPQIIKKKIMSVDIKTLFKQNKNGYLTKRQIPDKSSYNKLLKIKIICADLTVTL